MERDFELEFKKLKLNETPDLWSRIEAGLSEKTPAAALSANTVLAADKYKFEKRIAWRRWGTLAAACLCIAVILPALSLIIGNMGGRKNDYSSAPASESDAVADEAGNAGGLSDTSYMTAASEMTNESGMTNAPGATQANEYAEAEASDMSEAVENSYAPADNGMFAEDSKNSDMVRSDEAADSLSEEAKQSSSMKAQYAEADVDIEDGQSFDNVVIEIEEAHKSGREVIYKAVIKQPDEGGLLSADSKISVVCNSDTKYGFDKGYSGDKNLKAGESYEVSLRYEQGVGAGESGRYVVVTVDED